MTAVVACRGLVKRYGERTAVAGIDLDVEAGSCFGLLGPNGAGKTTTLRMIYGVTQPSAGSVRVFGLDVAHEARRVRARLGVTLQENALIETLSAADNLRVFGRYHRLHGAEIEARIGELLDFLELRSHAGVPVKQLSGGFQRRLAIALSLMNRPELLILDEPTTGLDPAVRRALWERVRKLRSDGTTVLLTTHYMDEAERLCDRLVILAEGRIVADGSPAALIRERLAAQALEIRCRRRTSPPCSRKRVACDTSAAARASRSTRTTPQRCSSGCASAARSPISQRSWCGRPTWRTCSWRRAERAWRTAHDVRRAMRSPVWWRNFSMYRRTWKITILPNFFEPLLYLVSIGVGVGAYVSSMGGVSYAAFLAPGLVAVAAMNGASFEVTYNAFVRLNFEKTYASMLTTPIEPEDVLAGEVLWAVTRATLYGGCFFVVIAAWGLAPLPAALFALPLLPLTGLLFAALGIVFALRVPAIEMFSFYFTLFLTPLFLFSDVFFPLNERLSGGWLRVAEILPLLHPVRLMRAAFAGTWSPILLWDLAYIAILSAGLLWVAARVTRRRLTS